MYPTNNNDSELDPEVDPSVVAPESGQEAPVVDPSGSNPVQDPNDQAEEVDPEIAKRIAENLQEDIKKALEQLLRDAREEDRFVRDNQLRIWKRLEFYWNNILDIFLDPVSRDWRVPDWDKLSEEGEIPPRLINIYRPLGEAVVAALSVTIPGVIFHPDDADNPDDIETAKAYGAITKLISSHDDDSMLFIRALTILFNQGTVFCYNYYHEDPKFGTIEKPRTELKDVNTFDAQCPQCGEPLDAGVQGNQEQSYNCQFCGYSGPAEIANSTHQLPQIVGWDKSPKGTICREMYSGLNIKVPAYAKNQTNCGYLLLEFAQSAAMLRSVFKNADIQPKYDSTWESFYKLPVQYLGEQPDNAANVSCLWLRPWQFYQLGNGQIGQEDIILELLKQYPEGCYAIFVNDEFMDACSENMDDHWSISRNPLGNFIYSRPLGENLATVQDIRAQLVEIELQTAEYGIPETFADERVLDFNKYGIGRAQPGMVTPVKPRAGKSIGDAFYTSKSAILSQEIDPLRQHIDQDAQLVSGAFPSVYGGVASGGSKTAAEYSQSKAMALQRLNTTWKIICEFWTQVESRSAVEYANRIKGNGRDEKFTQKQGSNNFINVWIRQASLNGKIGKVEPEASEQLPISWAQQKDVIMELMKSGLDPIIEVLTHPNNAGLMKNIFGLNDLFIPGEDNRIRQYKEFQLTSQGIDVPAQPLIDDEAIHIAVLQHILEGPLGEALNQEGQQATMMHLQMHMQSMAQKAAQQAQEQQSAQGPGSAPVKSQKENSNV